MGSYIVRVVSSTDPEVSADDRVTEAVLSDIDRLFSEICRGIVRAELRLQGDVPESLYAHLGIGSQGALAHDARRFLDETLDYLGGTTRGTWMDDSYPDVPSRKRIDTRKARKSEMGIAYHTPFTFGMVSGSR